MKVIQTTNWKIKNKRIPPTAKRKGLSQVWGAFASANVMIIGNDIKATINCIGLNGAMKNITTKNEVMKTQALPQLPPFTAAPQTGYTPSPQPEGYPQEDKDYSGKI